MAGTEAGAGLLDALAAGAAAATPAELVATALGLAYIVLAIRRHRGCWIAGGASTAIYAWVFHASGLPAQALLQVGYVALSVWGWMAWQVEGQARITPLRWPPVWHAVAAAAVGLLSAVTLALRGTTDLAALGDTLGAWASVAATWMLVRKATGSWIWWIVIDTGLAALFLGQGLVFTAALYLAFALLACAGWRSWRRAAAAA